MIWYLANVSDEIFENMNFWCTSENIFLEMKILLLDSFASLSNKKLIFVETKSKIKKSRGINKIVIVAMFVVSDLARP